MAIPAHTQDGLSCLYSLRQLPSLVPGKSVFVTIHHDRKNYDVEVHVEAIESVHGPWGEGEALRLLAIMPFRGIFSNEGNIRFWLTNDLKRVPVMMEASMIMGQWRRSWWNGHCRENRLDFFTKRPIMKNLSG